MDTQKIIRQSLKLLGLNRSDLDVNTNPYIKTINEELEDIREQILDKFEFQIKISSNLATLPETNNPPIYVNGVKLIAHNCPTDLLHIRGGNGLGDEYIRLKGNILYLPYGTDYIEYYSKDIPYQDFPVYLEKYVMYNLLSNVSVFLGRDNTKYIQLIQIEKQLINDSEKRNEGFQYGESTLRRY